MDLALPTPLAVDDLSAGDALWFADLSSDGGVVMVRGEFIERVGSWMVVRIFDGSGGSRIARERGCRWQATRQSAVLQRLKAECYGLTFAIGDSDEAARTNRILHLAWSLDH